MHRVWVVSGFVTCAGAAVSSVGFAQTGERPDRSTEVVSLQPTQPQRMTQAPFINRANELMPSWLRVRGEFRERVEGFAGAGFNADRDDLYYLSRVRLEATVTPAKHVSFQVQAQDARVGKKSIGPTGTPFKAPIDLRTAFADIGHAKSRYAVRVGRQEFVFGEQRLVGHVSWLNAARTFDAARVTMRTSSWQVDAFGGSLVRILDGRFDRSGNGNRFAGAHATSTSLIPLATVEPYTFWRRDEALGTEDGALGTLSAATLGVRVAGRLPARLDYGVEMALQRGSLGNDRVETWAGHWQVRELITKTGTVRVVGEYNFASGDKDSTDGVRGTFDQLYPTPHDKYGLADQFGWKNIHHVRAGVEVTPIKGLPITANAHSWWLAEGRDAVYAASSAPLFRVAGGAADRHVGQEIDVQVSRTLTPQLQLAGGYAHIFPGAFLKQTTPGASYSFPYVMVTYIFLAER